jgi:formylmethanofuran dehydrogenase subunit B
MAAINKKIHANIVCTGCSLLCDDILLEMEGDKMVRCINACKRGREKYQYYINEPGALSLVRHPGKSGNETIAYEAAITEAAKILKQAKHPLIYGFTSCALEDQAALLDLVGKLNAAITSPALRCLSLLFNPTLSHRFYTGTLGEAINKADVFVFWNSDPIESHPRLLSKLIYTRGLFRMTGYEVKKYLMVQPEKLEKFRGTTLSLKIPLESELAALDALEATLTGRDQTTFPGDVEKKDFDTLGTVLKHAEYVIFFVDKRLLISKDFEAVLGKLLKIIDVINQKERAMLLPLPEDMNSMGLFQHITHSGRFPLSEIDWNQPDAILVGGVESTTEIPTELLNATKKVPMIFLPQEDMMLSRNADVVIPVAAPGITTAGSAMRLDGVSLPLKPVITAKANTPIMARVIQDLINQL